MPGRHARTRFALQRTHLNGAFIGTAAAGAIAITLIAAGPAQSEQKNAKPLHAQALALNVPAGRTVAHKAVRIPVPGKGMVAAPKAKTKMIPTAADAVKLAVSQVGITENAMGGGTKFQKWFVSSPFAELGVQRDGGSISDYANANWCDMFVSWIGDQLHVKNMGVDAFTRTHAQWFKDHGQWGETPKPGAVVFYAWNGGGIDGIDHVGLVVKDNHDGSIQTVEGNTDNAVKVRTRDTSSVVGYGYPQYAQ